MGAAERRERAEETCNSASGYAFKAHPWQSSQTLSLASHEMLLMLCWRYCLDTPGGLKPPRICFVTCSHVGTPARSLRGIHGIPRRSCCCGSYGWRNRSVVAPRRLPRRALPPMADYRSGFGGMEDYRRQEMSPLSTFNNFGQESPQGGRRQGPRRQGGAGYQNLVNKWSSDIQSFHLECRCDPHSRSRRAASIQSKIKHNQSQSNSKTIEKQQKSRLLRIKLEQCCTRVR